MQDFFPTASVSGVITLVITGKGPLCSLVLWADVRCYKWFPHPACVCPSHSCFASFQKPRSQLASLGNKPMEKVPSHQNHQQNNTFIIYRLLGNSNQCWDQYKNCFFLNSVLSQAQFQAECFSRKDLFCLVRLSAGPPRTGSIPTSLGMTMYLCMHVCMDGRM